MSWFRRTLRRIIGANRLQIAALNTDIRDMTALAREWEHEAREKDEHGDRDGAKLCREHALDCRIKVREWLKELGELTR